MGTSVASPASSLIELRGVGKQFEAAGGPVKVLKDVTLAVEPGEYVAIVGKSGSGKSTLLNLITGIDHPSEGSVTIQATDIHGLDESRLARWRGRSVGIVFQFFQLVPTLTVRENLLLAMDFVGSIPKPARSARAASLLELVGITAHADKLPASLSGGEQQRAAIARALANDPPVLVADEPTGNLDSRTTQAIQRLFRDLVDAGKTVIVVTHEDVSQADYSRVITLLDGSVVGDRAAAAPERWP